MRAIRPKTSFSYVLCLPPVHTAVDDRGKHPPARALSESYEYSYPMRYEFSYPILNEPTQQIAHTAAVSVRLLFQGATAVRPGKYQVCCCRHFRRLEKYARTATHLV